MNFTGIIRTEGGNGGGVNCVFPYLYKEMVLYDCNNYFSDRPWCATTDNYNRDKKYGMCIGTSVPQFYKFKISNSE